MTRIGPDDPRTRPGGALRRRDLLARVGATLGVLGLGLYLTALATLFGMAMRLYRTSPTPVPRAYAALVAVTALGIALNGLTGLPLSHPFLVYTFFWIAGAVVSAVHEHPAA